MNMRSIEEERFWRKVSPEPNSGCWLWTGGISSSGYGHISKGIGKKGTMLAHHFALQHFKGITVPQGMDTLHACDVKCCVNPDHLSVGTRQDNVLDCIQKGRFRTNSEAMQKRRLQRTHCRHGHLLTEEIIYIDAKGTIRCRTCHMLRMREKRAPSHR